MTFVIVVQTLVGTLAFLMFFEARMQQRRDGICTKRHDEAQVERFDFCADLLVHWDNEVLAAPKPCLRSTIADVRTERRRKSAPARRAMTFSSGEHD